MKILQITSGTAVNGAVLYCKFLTRSLAQMGHDVTLMVRQDSCLRDQTIEGAETLVSEMNRSPLEIARVAKWIRQHKIDVIHTHMSRAHAFGVLLKMITGVPVIATAHSCSFQLHWKLNDYVIANSDSTRNYHARVNRIADNRMETVYCFSDLNRFLNANESLKSQTRHQCGTDSDAFVLAMVGEVVPRKGQIFLLKALPKVIAAVPSMQLWMIGRYARNESYTRRLRAIERKCNLESRIHWLGLRSDVQNYMHAADLSVVPSLEEPLGLVALESLATGTPVVATNTGGLPEIVHDGFNGAVVPPRSVDALADAIIKLAADERLRMQMGNTGRQQVIEQFDPQRLTDRVEQIYREVLDRKHRRAA